MVAHLGRKDQEGVLPTNPPDVCRSFVFVFSMSSSSAGCFGSVVATYEQRHFVVSHIWHGSVVDRLTESLVGDCEPSTQPILSKFNGDFRT